MEVLDCLEADNNNTTMRTCRKDIVKRCVQKKAPDCGSDEEDDEGCPRKRGRRLERVCEEVPVVVERLQRVKECHVEPVTKCDMVPIRTCRNRCLQEEDGLLMRMGRRRTFKCGLRPQRECSEDGEDVEPPSSCPCRTVEVERCRTRIPGCRARECVLRPRRRCRLVRERRCPEPECDRYPVRKCQGCPPRQFCHDHLERTCRREARPECLGTASEAAAAAAADRCQPSCSTAYVCPICRKGRELIPEENGEHPEEEEEHVIGPIVAPDPVEPRLSQVAPFRPSPRVPLSFQTVKEAHSSAPRSGNVFASSTPKFVPVSAPRQTISTSRVSHVRNNFVVTAASSVPPFPPFVTYYKDFPSPQEDKLPEYRG